MYHKIIQQPTEASLAAQQYFFDEKSLDAVKRYRKNPVGVGLYGFCNIETQKIILSLDQSFHQDIAEIYDLLLDPYKEKECPGNIKPGWQGIFLETNKETGQTVITAISSLSGTAPPKNNKKLALLFHEALLPFFENLYFQKKTDKQGFVKVFLGKN